MVVDTDLARVVLPKNFLRPCLLLLLHESPAHGYELRERLRPLGFNRDDPGRLYRALRALEEAELVRSAWQSSAGGPDRRTYELTRAGEERLLEAVAELQAMHAVLDRFLLRCAETACAPTARTARRTGPADAASRQRGDGSGMRVVVIGAGLGGLGAAMRLQGAGHDVTVVEARERPGGRAYQLRDAGYTWDTGPSLVTMPWVLEETFAAAGMDLQDHVQLDRLDPFYRIRWAQHDEHLDFVADRDRDALGAREVLGPRRRRVRRLHGRDEADLRGGDPRRRAAPVRARERPREVHAVDAAPRRGAAAVARGLRALRTSARARGVLVSLAVHRRRPLSRTSHLWSARLPAVPRRGLVRPRRGLRDRRGHGEGARRPLLGARRAHRAPWGRR